MDLHGQSYLKVRERLLALGKVVVVHPTTDPHSAAVASLLVVDYLAQPELAKRLAALVASGDVDPNAIENLRHTARSILYVLLQLDGYWLLDAPEKLDEALTQRATALRGRMLAAVERNVTHEDAKAWIEAIRKGSGPTDLLLDLRSLANLYRDHRQALEDSLDATYYVTDGDKADADADAIEAALTAGESDEKREWRRALARLWALFVHDYAIVRAAGYAVAEEHAARFPSLSTIAGLKRLQHKRLSSRPAGRRSGPPQREANGAAPSSPQRGVANVAATPQPLGAPKPPAAQPPMPQAAAAKGIAPRPPVPPSPAAVPPQAPLSAQANKAVPPPPARKPLPPQPPPAPALRAPAPPAAPAAAPPLEAIPSSPPIDVEIDLEPIPSAPPTALGKSTSSLAVDASIPSIVPIEVEEHDASGHDAAEVVVALDSLAPVSAEVVAVSPPPQAADPDEAMLPEAISAGSIAPGAEARQSERHDIELEVGFSSESNFYVGFTENLSSGGVFVATFVTKPIGSRVALKLTLPGSDDQLEIRGTVRWIRGYSDHSSAWPGMGIQFEHLSPAEEQIIKKFLALREPMFFDE